MKKLTFLILAVILILGIGIYYQVKIAKLPIERVLPEGAMVYVRVSDVEKQIEEFKATKLWRNITNIDEEMLMKKSGLSQEQIEQYKNVKRNFHSSLAELVLYKYFGREIAVAYYPSKLKTFEPGAFSEAASDIIVVTRLKPGAEFIEFVTKLFNKFNQKVQISQEKYKGREITVIKLNDKFDIAYVKIRDLLVIGLGKKAAHVCLDVVTKEKSPFSRDKDYISTMSKLPKAAQAVAYVNLELLFSGLKQFVTIIPKGKETTAEAKAKFLKTFDKMAGFKTMGYASVSGKISKDKTIWLFDKSKMNPSIAKAYSLKPQNNNTINFVPKDIIGYQWSTFDAKLLWNDFKQILTQKPAEAHQGPSPTEALADIEKELGMSIEKDIIPAFGNEIGGFLSDIDLGGVVPIPEVILFVKINDKAAIEKMMSALTKNDDFSMQSEEYNDVHIKYIALPFGTSLQPAYCFLKDYLLISIGRKPIKASIDTLAGKSMSLPANEDFKALDFGLTDKNNAVYFLKFDLLLTKLRGICEWGFGWVSLASTQARAIQQNLEREIEGLEKDIKGKESELEILQATLKSRRNEIENLQSQGLDVTFQQQELTRLEDKLRFKKEELDLTKKDLEEKERSMDITSASPMAKIDTSIIRLYLDKVVYPILEGLKEVKAIGSRSIFSENMLETQSFTKTEK